MAINFNYSVPFLQESATIEGEFLIQGIAINETITSNNHKFIAEELIKAANTLTGVPLLVDHENKVENIKGRVIYSGFDEMNKCVPFKAKVMDKMCQDMIKDGRLNSVSVGATVQDVEEDGEGHLIPRGIEFKELSLVAVPADAGATFTIALKEAYKSTKVEKEPVVIDKSQSNKFETEMKGGITMSEQTTESVKTEAVVDSNKILLERLDAMEKANKEMTEKLNALTAPQMKAEVKEEDSDMEEDYKIVSGHKYFTIIQSKY